VFLIRIAAALLSIALAGCGRLPETYAPPVQSVPPQAPDTSAMMLEMDQPDLDLHIVKDVHPRFDTPWRWTDREGTLKVLAVVSDHVKLSVDFSIYEPGFPQTGPLTLEFLVNGHSLDKIRYETPGLKHFEKGVPPEWLWAVDESTIAVKVDKLYVDPHDGAKFGVILARAGFAP
jgi:predicted small lipoprotein YifL